MKKVEKLAKEIREAIKDPCNMLARSHGFVSATSIERILDKNCPIEKPFPKVMIGKHSGALVYFTDRVTGTVIKVGHSYERSIGDYSCGWEDCEFKDCEIQIK